MNRIHGYNPDKCLMCGNDTFAEAIIAVDENEFEGKVCDKCHCVIATKGEDVYFAGFMNQDTYLDILTKEKPLIKATLKNPINPIAN